MGDSTNLQLGYGTKLSPNGQYLAVKTTSGVRVYKNTNGNWAQLGQEIVGNSHYSPAISNNGRVVFGEPYSSKNVYVYQYVGSSWSLVHSSFTTGDSGFGQAVAISGDGTRVAVASHNGSWTGDVLVIRDTGSSWQQLGNVMTGTYDYWSGKERLGQTGVQFSSDGNSILASAYSVVRVFDYNGSVWNQRASIDRTGSTESGISTFGNYSSGNFDFSRIVVGQYGFEGINPTPTPTPPIPLGAPTALGKVMIYDWDSLNQTYVLTQTIIPNFNQPSLFGHATSMTLQGDVIAVGGYLYGDKRGVCGIYKKYGASFIEIYEPISDSFVYGGQGASEYSNGNSIRYGGERLGYQVSLATNTSGNNLIAISSPNHSTGSNSIAGKVIIRNIS